MHWGLYGAFLVFAVLLVLAPGPDTTVVLKNCMVGGRKAGLATVAGVTVANFVQGTLAALGVGELIVRSQPVFDTIRYVGAAYLCYLGVQAFRAARRGHPDETDEATGSARRSKHLRWWSQGLLSNLTNPKVLAMYLSVLPQFMARGHAGVGFALLLAYTIPVLSATWQLVIVAFAHRMRAWIRSRRVRSTLDAATGTALIGFGVALAAER
jgi:threonine/homoserine/homoserine lactone efflux protein